MTVPVLAEVRRGGALESAHRGGVVAVDPSGRIVAACGDPQLRSFARSSIKPLQALPLVADGGVDRFGITPAELAVICGSHSGEPAHVAAVRSILRKIDLEEDALQCTGHWPYHQPAAEAMRARGETPGAVHDNCSGKHAGMLALSRLHGWDHRTYRRSDHPVQQRIREAVAAGAGTAEATSTAGIDGCGVPTYHVALRDLALAFARLTTPEALPPMWREAARAVTAAMSAHPEMVAGTGRLDTVVMSVVTGRFVSKGGAEAIAAVGVPGRLGLAVKIEDGGARAVGPVLIEALRQLELITPEEVGALAAWHHPPLPDRQGRPVAEISPVFGL